MAKIKGNAKDNDLFGTSGGDTVVALAGDDFLFGANGNDRMQGGGGDDELNGGSGRDRMTGGAGVDVVVGGKGDDVLKGGTDGDELSGGAGDDILVGGTGKDIMSGGAGDDVFRFLPGIETPPGPPNVEVIGDFNQVAGNGGDKLQIPAGSTIIHSVAVVELLTTWGWYLEYSGAGNSGFVLLTGVTAEPDYEFV